MAKDHKLSDKEAALIAAARRELAAPRAATTPTSPVPAAATAARPPAPPAPLAAARPVSTPLTAEQKAEQFARLMAEEAAHNRRRRKREQLYLVVIPLVLMILGFAWVLLTTLPKLR